MPEWMNSAKARAAVGGVLLIAVAAGVWWFTRPAPPTNAGNTTFADLVDEEAVDELNEAPIQPYREQVDAVAQRLRRIAGPQLAEGVRETMLAIAEPDVQDMLQTWRDQGRTPQASGWPAEKGTIQEMHERRRASLLRAEFRPEQIALVDPDMQQDKLDGYREAWGMSPAIALTRRRDGQLGFLGGSIPSDQRSEVLIPGNFFSARGEPFEGVFAIGMIWNPEQSWWVMLSIGYHPVGTGIQPLLPLF